MQRWLSLNWRRAEATRIRMRYFYCDDNDNPLRLALPVFFRSRIREIPLWSHLRMGGPVGRTTERINRFVFVILGTWKGFVCGYKPTLLFVLPSYHTDFYAIYLVQFPFQPVSFYLFASNLNPPPPPGHPIPWIVIRFYKWLSIHMHKTFSAIPNGVRMTLNKSPDRSSQLQTFPWVGVYRI